MLATLLLIAAAAATPTDVDALTTKARAILDSRCLFCHGEDPEGGFRVDSRAALLKGGKSGPPFTPGVPDKGTFVDAIRRTHSKPMPPKTALPDEEVEILVAWIAAGAPFRDDAAGAAKALVKRKDAAPVRLKGFEGAGPTPLRRLTSDEYLASVRALFGTAPQLPFPLPQDAVGSSGFVTAAVVSAVEAGRFLSAAEALGTAAQKRLGMLLPCDPGSDGEDTCAREFIIDFGRRAFRRPLTLDESQRLFDRYRHARRALKHDFENAMRMVIEAVLVSPQFLYHDESGPTAAATATRVVKLSPHELAARLSYFLTAGPPDVTLAAAADAGALQTPEQVAFHARRLLESGQADKVIAAFHAQWLHLDHVLDLQKNDKLFKEWNPKLVQAMAKETETFVHHVFFEDGHLDTLLSAHYTFVNERLAKLYGIKGVKGEHFRWVDVDPQQRAGVLTHPSFLATLALPAGTSPVKRGKTIMQDLLCLPPPPPPPGFDFQPPSPKPNAQTRELYSEHSANKQCAGCHAQMDPVGFAFESYDTLGRFRTEEAGRPLDTTGTLLGLAGGPRPFKNARELIDVIAHSDEARRCVAKKWMRFALGRLETDEEAPSFEQIFAAFASSNWDMRELVIAVAQSRSFLYRVEQSPPLAHN